MPCHATEAVHVDVPPILSSSRALAERHSPSARLAQSRLAQAAAVLAPAPILLCGCCCISLNRFDFGRKVARGLHWTQQRRKAHCVVMHPWHFVLLMRSRRNQRAVGRRRDGGMYHPTCGVVLFCVCVRGVHALLQR